MNSRRLRLPLIVTAIDIVAAAVTWLGWHAAGHGGARAAIAVLLLATPIGMVLATVLPRVLTQRVGHRLGVTSLDDSLLEQWGGVRTLVIDPFRTLTTGNLVVTDVHPVDPDHERNLRWFAGALAHSYDDPIGRAVAKLAGRGRLTNVAQEPGLGIRGSVDRHPVRVGHPQWIGVPENPAVRVGTAVAVDVDQRPLGQIVVAEEVRLDAARQLDRLRRSGLTPALASARREEEIERLARLSSSQTWHAETDPYQYAKELAAGEGLVGLVRGEPDDSATILMVDGDEDIKPDDSPELARLDSASVDTVVHAAMLAVRSRRTERRAQRLAWLLLLLPLPFAAARLLPPLVALGVAVVTWIVIGLAASWEFAGIRLPAEPTES